MSGVGSCAAGGRTESPTAMMRIAKIAELAADGGGNPGGLDAGAGGTDGAAASGTDGDESLRRRGPGGSLRGRGGEAIGRSAFEFACPVPMSAGSAGSEGVRALPAAPMSGKDGFERRRIGGG